MTVCLLWQRFVAEMATDHGQCTNDNHNGISMGQLLHTADSYISLLICEMYTLTYGCHSSQPYNGGSKSLDRKTRLPNVLNMNLARHDHCPI